MKKYYLISTCYLLNFSFLFCQWMSVNPMNMMRSSHVSAKLTDGSIFVAGGFGESTQTKSAEIMDPLSGIWINTSTEMSEFHSSGTATLLPTLTGDKVLVTGGWTGAVNTQVCEIFDALTQTWMPAASLGTGRADHTATLLPSGKVLVVGGYDGINNLTSCEIYDPLTNTWSMASSLTTGRSSHTATLLNDGRVLVAGGYNPNAGFQLMSTEIYTPSTDSWSNGPDMSAARNWHAASILSDGRVFISGGEQYTGASPFAYEGTTSAEIFDPATDMFTAAQNLPTGLSYHKQVSFGEYVMVIAGKEKTDYLNSVFTSTPGITYLYHVNSDSWQEKPMNMDGRIYFTAHLTNDNKVIVLGGQTDEVEIYDPIAGLSDLKGDEKYLLMPNPVASVLTFYSSEGTSDFDFEIKNLVGQQITKKHSQKGQLFQFDVSAYESGVYIFEAEQNSKKTIIRFVKE